MEKQRTNESKLSNKDRRMSYYPDYGDNVGRFDDEPKINNPFSTSKKNEGGYLPKEKATKPGSDRASEFFDKYDLFGEEVPRFTIAGRK